jgi:hypothetical protein
MGRGIEGDVEFVPPGKESYQSIIDEAAEILGQANQLTELQRKTCISCLSDPKCRIWIDDLMREHEGQNFRRGFNVAEELAKKIAYSQFRRKI